MSPENTLQEALAPEERGIINSSLVKTVLTLAMARESAGTLPKSLVLPPRYEAMRTLGSPAAAVALITADPEFTALATEMTDESNWQFKGNPEKWRAVNNKILSAYVGFLTGDADFASKVFIASPRFRQHMIGYTKYHHLGPYFLKLMEGIRHTNLDTIAFVNANLELFGALDEYHYNMEFRVQLPVEDPNLSGFTERQREYKEACIRSFAGFQSFNDQMLALVFDTNDQSDWRLFVMQNFGVIVVRTTLFDPESYNPHPHLAQMKKLFAQIKKLFEAVPEEERNFLGEYLLHLYPNERQMLDPEILNGQLDRAKKVTEFKTTLASLTDARTTYSGEGGVLDYWIKRFLEGAILEEDFLSIPSHWQSRRNASFSLPREAQEKMAFYGSTEKEKDGSIKVGFLKTPAVYEDGDLIAQLVSAGIYPTQETRDLVRDNIELLGQISAFSKELLALVPPKEAIGVINAWVNTYLSDPSPEPLGHATEYLKLLKEIDIQITSDKTHPLFEIWEVIRQKFYHAKTSIMLLKAGFWPTDLLTDYIRKNGEVGLDTLIKLKVSTKQGNFDPENPLQKDLEFTTYLHLIKEQINEQTDLDALYKSFQNIEYSPEPSGSSKSTELTGQEIKEADVAAIEAAKFYWFIKGRIEAGRQLIVIGNKRYGELFVVRPLERLLAELNLNGKHIAYVSSSKTRKDTLIQLFDDKLNQSFFDNLVDKSPDVVFVDGTPNIATAEGHSRFPGSARAFLNWFLVYNEACGAPEPQGLENHLDSLRKLPDFETLISFLRIKRPNIPYTISHYMPGATETVVIGEVAMPYIKPGDESPQAIIANPVIDTGKISDLPSEFGGHVPGFFDDPEKYTHEARIIQFGRDGIENRTIRPKRDDYTFIALVQQRIAGQLDRAVRATDPDSEQPLLLK